MAIIKKQDIKKMSEKETKDKIAELKMQLIKASVSANKTNAKTKEIKKTIARLITFNKLQKNSLKKK